MAEAGVRRLAVDVGTSTTTAAVLADGRATPLVLGRRSTRVPTMVFVTPSGAVRVGEEAVRRLPVAPQRTAAEFVPAIGGPTGLRLGDRVHAPAELAAEVVDWVVARADEQLGPARQLVLVVPPLWGPAQRRPLLDAVARRVDLPIGVMPATTAAAEHHARRHRVGVRELVAVLDHGGSGAVAALHRRRSRGFELVGLPQANALVRWTELERLLLDHVLDPVGIDAADLRPQDLVRLRGAIEAAQPRLWDTSRAAVHVDLPDGDATEVTLHRGQVEELLRPPLRAVAGLLETTLGSADVGPEQLSCVVLVGGGARIPLASELASLQLGRPVVVPPTPELAAVLGAAARAGPAQPLDLATPGPAGVDEAAPSGRVGAALLPTAGMADILAMVAGPGQPVGAPEGAVVGVPGQEVVAELDVAVVEVPDDDLEDVLDELVRPDAEAVGDDPRARAHGDRGSVRPVPRRLLGDHLAARRAARGDAAPGPADAAAASEAAGPSTATDDAGATGPDAGDGPDVVEVVDLGVGPPPLPGGLVIVLDEGEDARSGPTGGDPGGGTPTTVDDTARPRPPARGRVAAARRRRSLVVAATALLLLGIVVAVVWATGRAAGPAPAGDTAPPPGLAASVAPSASTPAALGAADTTPTVADLVADLGPVATIVGDAPRQVVVRDAAGARVVSGAHDVGGGPAVAPDGTDVLLVAVDGDRRRLLRAPVDGATAPVEVATGPGAVHDPAWAPDGERVVFSLRLGAVRTIRVLELASGRLTDLTFGADDRAPAWSPDGTSIAFHRHASGDGGAAAGEVLVVPADASAPPRALAPAGDGWRDPSWSPDGSSLAVVAAPADGPPGVLLVDVATGRSRPLDDGHATALVAPAWAGDDVVLAEVPGAVPAVVAVAVDGGWRVPLGDGAVPAAPVRPTG